MAVALRDAMPRPHLQHGAAHTILARDTCRAMCNDNFSPSSTVVHVVVAAQLGSAEADDIGKRQCVIGAGIRQTGLSGGIHGVAVPCGHGECRGLCMQPLHCQAERDISVLRRLCFDSKAVMAS